MYFTDDPERDLHHWQKVYEEAERQYEIASEWIMGEFLTLVEQAIKAVSIEQLNTLATFEAVELEYFYDHVCDELQKPDHPTHFCMSALIAGDDEQCEYWARWIVNILEPVKVYKAYHDV